jgi:hypothetical protein
MLEQELLIQVVHALEECKVPYMLTGSYVSSLQGFPRSTHDIDIVVLIDASKLPKLKDAFAGPSFYLDEQSMREAIREGGMFNLIESSGGNKIDFWVLTDSAFDRSRFSRRYGEEAFGQVLVVSSPEDTILMKLLWARMSGGSEKQMQDALGVYELQFGKLDRDYLRRWAATIGVEEELGSLEEKARPLE